MDRALLGLGAMYATALFALLWVAHRRRGRYALAKGVCSALFVACGLLAWHGGAHGDVVRFALLQAGLVLCAFGDVLLGVANQTAGTINQKPFLAAVAAFSLAHMFFCAMLYRAAPPAPTDLVLPAVLVACLLALERTGKIRLKKLRATGIMYTFLVGLMAGKAVTAWALQGAFGMGAGVLALGAVLFMASDVLLLFLYFGALRAAWLRGANLALYYAGAWLLALAAYWF